MRGLRSRVPLVAGALLALIAPLGGCRRDASRVPPRQAVLERRIEGARRLLAAARQGPLVSFQQMLVVVDERLIGDLISSVTPYERVVDDTYRVRVDSAAVEFQAGFALVRLDGRASLKQAALDEAYADVSLYSGLDVLGVDPATGVLRARLNIIAFTARRVGVLGMQPPVRRLVEDLTREELSKFQVFNSDLEIPVRFDETLKLPEVDAGDEDDRVRIPAARIPLRVSVQDVKAIARKLWIPIAVAVPPDSVRTGGGRSAGAPRARRDKGIPLGDLVSNPTPGSAAFATLGLGRPLGGQRPDSLERRRREAELRATYEALQDSIIALSASDPLLIEAAADSGDVALFVRPALLELLARQVAAVYLDHVELDLTPEKPVDEAKPLEVETPVGEIKAGDWSVVLHIHRLRGVLKAGTPRLAFSGPDRIHLTVPVSIVRGQGSGILDFTWDAKSLVEIVCDDFATTLDISGVVLPGTYQVTGDYVLTAQAEKILARPEFPREKFRIKVDLTSESWAKVRGILESQNESGKCGVVDVDDLTEKLEEIGQQKGFKVKLPRSILKMVEIPARVSESVEFEDRRVRLDVQPEQLRTAPSVLWYTAAVEAEPGGPAPGSVPAGADSIGAPGC
jgi:hypothetical protein